MKKIILVCLLFLSTTLSAQNKFKVEGNVKDESTNEPLIGVVIKVRENNAIGTVTDLSGNYTLQLSEGNYTLIYQYIGYLIKERPIQLTKDLNLNVFLSPDTKVEKEIIVTGERPDKNIQDTRISTQEVNIAQIKKLPALFGEVDVIKNIQMLPGIQVAGEGNTGLFVRGGGPDQNLILIDEAPVYNASHLLGMFSIFNSDVLKSAEIYKGGIPAQHGGRLSSLLDIRTRDGNNKTYSASGGIGLISSRLTLEGPIKRDKSSFILSGRRTYGDLFLMLSPDEGVNSSRLYFYDLNAKLTFNINPKNKVYFSGYYGRDAFKFSDFFQNNWGNTAATLRWTHIFNDKLVGHTSLIHSAFDYELRITQSVQAFKFTNGVKEYSIKQDFNYFLDDNNELAFGVSAGYRTYFPGKFSPTTQNSIFKDVTLSQFHNLEEAVYLSNKQKFGPRITVEYGLRYSLFQNTGGSLYKYNGQPENNNIYDTINYGRFETIKNFDGFEPRLSGRYLLDENSSLKLSYNRMIQYIHLMNNSTSPVPYSVWLPSTPYLRPEKADQVAGGYFRNFLNNKIETSVEAYYKKMYDVIDFKDNAQLILNPHMETEVRAGNSWSYGLELFIKKNTGPLTGWISYTWSKTERNIPGVNDGKTYFASYDRRHNANFVGSYDINSRWNISANWVYGTGRPINLPVAKYNMFDNKVPALYPERNYYRMPAYHRLDLAVTLNSKKKEGRKWESSWNFSIYNLYARKNPFTMMIRDKADSPGEKEVIMIYFPAPIPSITYNFKF
ncbi:MAG: TonB-dependent receptor [Cytophagaceae bacterium]